METEQEVPPGGPNDPHANEAPDDDFFGEEEAKPAPDRSVAEAAAEKADGEKPKFDPVTQTAAAPAPAEESAEEAGGEEPPTEEPPTEDPPEGATEPPAQPQSSGKTPVRQYKILQEVELTKATLEALLKEQGEDGAEPRTALFLLGELTDRQPDTAKKAAYRQFGPWPQPPKLAAVPERYLDPRVVKPRQRPQPDEDLVIE